MLTILKLPDWFGILLQSPVEDLLKEFSVMFLRCLNRRCNFLCRLLGHNGSRKNK